MMAAMKTSYALLVIDMQLVAFDGKITPPIVDGSQLLDKVSDLIDVCRADDIPVVYLQTCALSGQPYARDTHGWEIHPRLLQRTEDRIVEKVSSSGFDDTKLQETLVDLGVEGIIVCGIWSEFCVTATSKAALEIGFEVCVAADGHGTVSGNEADVVSVNSRQNSYLAGKGARVVDIKDIRANLAP
jgi:nicotinamidase-related amidase